MIKINQTGMDPAASQECNKVCGLGWIARELAEALKEDFQQAFDVCRQSAPSKVA
jgi:hypothetical protein